MSVYGQGSSAYASTKHRHPHQDDRAVAVDTVPSMEASLKVAVEEPLSPKLVDGDSVDRAASRQAVPGGSQTAPRKRHRVRTVLIVLGIGAILYVALAVATK